ncbi:right-handed parallel beta-helix repeat-containing protein, partial [Candidatus Woesearchaeota archaeon]|nr:right-handed parallel beta-helix repeat-containing protein [Candidatus Woesearchaeota archaeon]
MKKRLFLIILILSAAISASTVFGACITPQDIGSSGNYTFCNGTYNLGESIDITANNVNLTCNGTVLYASTYASYSGIIIGNYENINIRGCNITNYYDAIYVDDGARDIIIDSNNMYYNNNSGIYIYEMHNGYINITSNNITNNYEGIYYDGYTPYTDEINIITNIVNDNSANGIGANANTETSTLRVISNEVIDNAGGVSWYVDDYAYVLDNYVKDNSGNGIGLFGVNGTESFEVKNNWVENNSDGIHLEGFSTGIYDNNTHKYNSRGLFLSNVHDLLIEDQLFEGNPAPPYGNGIRAEYCSNITISNADVGYNVEGLSFHTCEDITVEDSRIYGGATSLDSQACAIYFISYSNDTFFVIDNNSITDNENISGICMQTTSQDLDNNDINITNNNISNNYYGIAAGGGGQFYAYDFDEVNIINNVVENNPHAGVFTGDHRILRVINNDVINCGTGISDHYTDEYAYVLDNNVTDNNGTGIEVQGLDGNETFDIENNWVENSGTGIFLQDFSTGTYDNNPIKGNGNDTFIGLQLINVGVLVIDGEIIDRQTYYAVDIQSCSNITLRNFDIGYSGGGISFTDTNFTVEGSRIYSGYDPYRQNCGIYSMYYADPTYSFNALINNNNITDNENITGICIEASAGNHSGYINITNNNIINNHGGIAGSAGYHYYDEVNIINNVVKDNKDYLGGGTYGGQGIYFGIQRIARIINNDVINNGATGISVGVDEYAYILDNNVTDNGAGGIALGGIGGDELFEFNNNWVENNTGIGIDIIGFGAGVYENNTHKYNGNAGLWLSQVNNLLIEDQIFEGNGNLAININA